MPKFYDVVINTLKKDSRFFTEDGEILRNAVYEATMKMDEKLLALLLSNAEIKRRFFTHVGEAWVFDKISFGWLINNRAFLPDSYTRFKNKIGLADYREKLISVTDDVQLVFPYKDCVLEGGQTKDDQKRNEIFYNKLLAPDEIDRLLYPKVFANAKRYSKDGEEKVTCIDNSDNLIIKGNNLLALTSLLKKYEGKIKCIYIDPPYYFGSKKKEDTFAYNTNFKLSTWLVFMKNRLECARRLLSEDGAIFVQISDDGVAELHLLLKEVFCRNGENNFINKITLKTKSPSGFASVNLGVFETAEYILAFAKNKPLWKYHPQYVQSEYDENYKWVITNKEEDFNSWSIKSISDIIANSKGYESSKAAQKALGKTVLKELVAQYALDNAEKVFRYTAVGNDAGQSVVEMRDKSHDNPDEIYAVERENQYTVYLKKGQEIAFYSKKVREIDGKKVPSIQLSNIWTDTPYEGIAKEGNVTLKGGKKPERLLKRIIEMGTNKGDIVLDYHLGSGTTCAVAHKLGRTYIGIEQLDYGDNDSVTRLRTVIGGDKSGISKIVEWQGGGSFIYCELAKLNQKFAEAIVAAETDKELAKVWGKMKRSGFISARINPRDINPDAKDFTELSFDEKKQLFMELLDMNQLYINYCDIDDKEFNISEEDKAFTKSFYKE